MRWRWRIYRRRPRECTRYIVAEGLRAAAAAVATSAAAAAAAAATCSTPKFCKSVNFDQGRTSAWTNVREGLKELKKALIY